MAAISTINLLESQVLIVRQRKPALYNLLMSFGTRIKLARERLNPPLTQQDIADAFKVTPQAVSGWERNKIKPDPDKLLKLADLLKVPVVWLLGGKGAPPAPADITVLVEDLTAAEMAAVIAMIESFRKSHGNAA
jgi:transcriptional regulator with XRE-family HTH domain